MNYCSSCDPYPTDETLLSFHYSSVILSDHQTIVSPVRTYTAIGHAVPYSGWPIIPFQVPFIRILSQYCWFMTQSLEMRCFPDNCSLGVFGSRVNRCSTCLHNMHFLTPSLHSLAWISPSNPPLWVTLGPYTGWTDIIKIICRRKMDSYWVPLCMLKQLIVIIFLIDSPEVRRQSH